MRSLNLSDLDHLQAIERLEAAISPDTIDAFERTVDPNAPVIRLTDCAASYQQLPREQDAWKWLQGQLPEMTLKQFAAMWRGEMS